MQENSDLQNSNEQQQLNEQESGVSKKTILISVVIALLLMPLAVFAGYQFGSRSKMTQSSGSISNPTPTTTPTCTFDAKICPDGSSVGRVAPNCEFAECPLVEANPTDPKLTLFDPTAPWFGQQPYPTSITSITSSELVEMTCSGQFGTQLLDGPYYSYPSGGSVATEFSDQIVLSQLDQIEKASGNRVDSFVHCQTSDSRELFVYVESSGGGGSNSKAFLAELRGDKYLELGELPNPGMAYFGCSKPLMLTKAGVFYTICSGGDGGSGATGIYAFNTIQKTVQEVAYCSSVVGNVECR